MKISELIKEQRKLHRITQEELAHKLNVSVTTVRRWEWGIRAPNTDILPKLAEKLHTSVAYLMGLSEDSQGKASINKELSEASNDYKTIESPTTSEEAQIVYSYGDHHLKLPATEAGYAAFNNFVATIASKKS